MEPRHALNAVVVGDVDVDVDVDVEDVAAAPSVLTCRASVAMSARPARVPVSSSFARAAATRTLRSSKRTCCVSVPSSR